MWLIIGDDDGDDDVVVVVDEDEDDEVGTQQGFRDWILDDTSIVLRTYVQYVIDLDCT